MASVFKLILLAILAFSFVTPIFANGLPITVKQQLKKAGIPESAVGVYVADVQSNKPAIAFNANTAMNPASVMKLVTTYAGLEILGPAYVWKTELYLQGEVAGGVLNGDLIIKGYGDPSLNLEKFWLLIYQLRQAGIRVISGNLILDFSHFQIKKGDPGAFDGQPHRAYNILPDALMVNYKTSILQIEPQPDKKRVQFKVDPIPESLQVINNVTLKRGRCGDWRRRLKINISTNQHNTPATSIALNGQYSTQCGKKNYPLSLHDNITYIGDLFKRLWTQQDGVFMGNVMSGETPSGMKPFKTYQSPPLTEVIRGINKYSNNIAARQLYLTMGAAKDSRLSPATVANSAEAVKQWLRTKQMNFSELRVENGSGLSRIERISPRHMGQLLQAAFKSPVMAEFMSSLPIAAIDGTMRKRLRRTAMEGMAHIKTGTLRSVKAMAGYMLDKRGRRKVVVFFIGHANADRGERAMDALLQWAYEENKL